MAAMDVNELSQFRTDLYRTFTRWADALFELCDAVVCASGPVGSVPSLSLEPEFSRSHGSLYKALGDGGVDEDRLRGLLVEHRPSDWPLVFAVDASTWDRCDAECSPDRGFYYSASRHSAGQPIVAGWSYQWICQLDWAPDSWTAPTDVARIPPTADATEVTIEQIRRIVGLLPDDEEVPLFVLDAGYDPIGIGDGLAAPRRGVLSDPRRPCLLRRSAAASQSPAGDRRPSPAARATVQMLRSEVVAGGIGQARRLRLPLRCRHGAGLARLASTPVGTRAMGGP